MHLCHNCTGVVLWELLTGHMPWESLNPMQASGRCHVMWCAPVRYGFVSAFGKRCINKRHAMPTAASFTTVCVNLGAIAMLECVPGACLNLLSQAGMLLYLSPCCMHALQVVGAVGFARKGLPPPPLEGNDPFLVELCNACRAYEPEARPTFGDIVTVSVHV